MNGRKLVLMCVLCFCGAVAAGRGSVAAEDVTPAVSPLPDGELLYWGREPVEETTSRRAEICLNGAWEFSPVATAVAPEKDYGYIRVPGAWYSVYKYMPGVIVRGQGAEWKNIPEQNGPALKSRKTTPPDTAWYRRTLTVPAAWAGRKILLDFEHLCTDAEVYLDGKKAGEIRWPGGETDITGLVTPGATAVLAVRVAARLQQTEVIEFMGNAAEQISKKKISLENYGITGDVFLKSLPRGAVVTDVFVQPSTRKKHLALAVEIRGAAAGEVKIAGACLNEKKISEKDFAETVTLTGKPVETVNLAVPWDNPRLWDFCQPNLYTLRLRVTGGGLDDETATVFGFREFWIAGRDYMLNGTPIRFRPRNSDFNQNDNKEVCVEFMDARIEALMSTGANIQEFWPWNYYQRGTVRMVDLWCSRADLKGWPVIAPLGSCSGFVGRWDTAAAERGEWQRLTTRQIRKLRNHPSILMWVHSPNCLGNSDDQSPRCVGNRRALENPPSYNPNAVKNYHVMLHGAKEANKFIKSLDPARPVSFHEGGAAGDIQMVNMYLSWLPVQEQEEWLSEHLRNGDMPFMPVEFGFFSHCDLRRGRNSWTGSSISEPQITEHLARLLGESAYRRELPMQRDLFPRTYRGGMKYQFSGIKTPAIFDLEYQMCRRIYQSWRTAGFASGMLYWVHGGMWTRAKAGSPQTLVKDFGPFVPGRRGAYVRKIGVSELYGASAIGGELSPSSRFNPETLSATAAWICGADISGDNMAFTAKDHHFTAGAPVKKRLVLVNDSRKETYYSATWEATAAGTTFAGKQFTGKLTVGEIRFLPVEFTAPALAKITDGQIKLSATFDSRVVTDEFALRFYPPAAPAGRKVIVFDPLGKTTKALRHAGVTVAAWDGKTADAAGKTLVIGREAMSADAPLPGSAAEFALAGGHVVVMQQQPQWWEKTAGMRTGLYVLREVFPLFPQPFAGLDAADLRDWTGQSTLRPERSYGNPQIKENSYHYGWHWSNRGGVCSAPLEKPHRGGWRTLLHGDFALQYAALMQARHGKGAITLCQLDVEDHAAFDPAARRALEAVVSVPIHAAAVMPVFYHGGQEDGDALREMGVTFTETASVPAVPGLLVLGRGGNLPFDTVKQFAQNGGKVFMLPDAPQAPATELRKQYSGIAEVPAWKVCAGLCVADLHVRAPLDMRLFKKTAGWETAANGFLARQKAGTGEIVCSRLTPRAYPAEEKTYFRFSRWLARRVTSNLLANLGADFREINNEVFLALARQKTWKDSAAVIDLSGQWQGRMHPVKNPDNDPGISETVKARLDKLMTDGEACAVPGSFELYGADWAKFDGETLFQREVVIPESAAGREMVLELGRVDDFDDTFWDGKLVGRIDKTTDSWWTVERQYKIPAALVTPGKHILSVRVFDRSGNGGILGGSGKPALRAVGAVFDRWYDADYRSDYSLGDSPHRYYRW